MSNSDHEMYSNVISCITPACMLLTVQTVVMKELIGSAVNPELHSYPSIPQLKSHAVYTKIVLERLRNPSRCELIWSAQDILV